MDVNYSKYNAQGLLEALSTIDSEAYPENYKNLTSEIASRRGEIDEYFRQQEEKKRNSWNKFLSFLGFGQMLTALVALVILVTSFSGSNLYQLGANLFVVLLSGSAGFTLLRKKSRSFLLTNINQGLQVCAFGVGGLYFNYSGLGGVFLLVDWVNESYNWISASFNIGGSLLDYSNQYELGFIQIDVLAIFFIWAVHKAKKITTPQ